jgi:hypothetical protein
LIVIFLISCDKQIDTKEFPVILTLNPTDIDSTGATFNGRLIKAGTNETTSYGFIWSLEEPNLDNSYKIITGSEIPEGVFTARVNFSLSRGFEYKIKVFATYNDKTVYGNTVKIISKGCDKSPWAKEISSVRLKDYQIRTYGFSDNNYGYVLFTVEPEGDIFRYDPIKNQFSWAYKSPVAGYTSSTYTCVNLNDDQYFFDADDSNKLYKLHNGVWTLQSYSPFNYDSFGGYYHGYAVSGKILILSSAASYSYDPGSNSWQKKMNIPGINYDIISIGGTDLNGIAYVMTTDKKIQKYDPDKDSWEYITSYPGYFKHNIIAFSHENKIYFGFSYSNTIDRSFWSFDISTKIWKETERFPLNISPTDIFYFYLKGKLYIGHHYVNSADTYELFSLDPSKF